MGASRGARLLRLYYVCVATLVFAGDVARGQHVALRVFDTTDSARCGLSRLGLGVEGGNGTCLTVGSDGEPGGSAPSTNVRIDCKSFNASSSWAATFSPFATCAEGGGSRVVRGQDSACFSVPGFGRAGGSLHGRVYCDLASEPDADFPITLVAFSKSGCGGRAVQASVTNGQCVSRGGRSVRATCDSPRPDSAFLVRAYDTEGCGGRPANTASGTSEQCQVEGDLVVRCDGSNEPGAIRGGGGGGGGGGDGGDDDDSSLGAGATAGIVIGCLGAAGIVTALAVYSRRRDAKTPDEYRSLVRDAGAQP